LIEIVDVISLDIRSCFVQ